jgi:predicted DNA-binding transcriptional regulator AlpA
MARTDLQARSFPPEIPANAWLTLSDVLQYVPVSRSTWERGIKSGQFPPPHKIKKLTFWTAREIRRLLEMGPRRARGRPVKPS